MSLSKSLLAKFEPDFKLVFVQATFAFKHLESRFSGSFRKYGKVFQRKNIHEKEILPQKGLSLQNIY